MFSTVEIVSHNYVVLRMDFSNIIGQEHLVAHLKTTLERGRIPHAQLFVGTSGSGLLPMAIAYANAILCSNAMEEREERPLCAQRVSQLAHPDLHFVYPVNTNDRVRKHPVSSLFLEDWREFVSTNPYGSQFQWLQQLGIENKQGNINVDEAGDMMKKLSLKSYEGGYKIMIVWMADAMNTACANKILKLVEEPPKNTLLLLLTENEEQIMGTIRSRCQTLHFPRLSDDAVASYLMSHKKMDQKSAQLLAHRAQGSIHQALLLLDERSDTAQFEAWFIAWVRTAFQAKGNKKAIHNLLRWSDELAASGRETQKKFLAYSIELFRQALLKNYRADPLLFFESKDKNFSLDKFAPFVHQNNIYEITHALEMASYHIERNGNAKIIFSDLSIQLTRLIHRKELV